MLVDKKLNWLSYALFYFVIYSAKSLNFCPEKLTFSEKVQCAVFKLTYGIFNRLVVKKNSRPVSQRYNLNILIDFILSSVRYYYNINKLYVIKFKYILL